MNRFYPDNIYLDFLAKGDIKDSRFLIIEIIFPIVCEPLYKESLNYKGRSK